MTSIDTNILFHAFNKQSPNHERAFSWLAGMQERSDVAISEFVLLEFYRLLQNPKALERPLNACDAVDVISSYREHPHWILIGFNEDSRATHDQIWVAASKQGSAYRKIYDIRIAVTIQAFGITEFATVNLKDFKDLGFRRLWNPIAT